MEKKAQGVSEVLAWVSSSPELKEKTNSEDEKAELTADIANEMVHEVAVRKGLAGVLKLFKERGYLKERMDEPGGWTEVKDVDEHKHPATEDKDEIVSDGTIHEGLLCVLNLLEERAALRKGIARPPNVYQEVDSIERTVEFGQTVSSPVQFLYNMLHVYMV